MQALELRMHWSFLVSTDANRAEMRCSSSRQRPSITTATVYSGFNNLGSPKQHVQNLASTTVCMIPRILHVLAYAQQGGGERKRTRKREVPSTTIPELLNLDGNGRRT